jgi:hypothetical protein
MEENEWYPGLIAGIDIPECIYTVDTEILFASFTKAISELEPGIKIALFLIVNQVFYERAIYILIGSAEIHKLIVSVRFTNNEDVYAINSALDALFSHPDCVIKIVSVEHRTHATPEEITNNLLLRTNKLTELYVPTTCVSRSTHDLLAPLRSSECTLTKLSFTLLQTTSYYIQPDAIVEAMKYNTSVKTLELHGCAITETQFIDLFAHNNTIESFSARSMFGVTRERLDISHNSALRKVNFMDRIGVVGVDFYSLVARNANNYHLRRLSLRQRAYFTSIAHVPLDYALERIPKNVLDLLYRDVSWHSIDLYLANECYIYNLMEPVKRQRTN